MDVDPVDLHPRGRRRALRRVRWRRLTGPGLHHGGLLLGLGDRPDPCGHPPYGLGRHVHAQRLVQEVGGRAEPRRDPDPTRHPGRPWRQRARPEPEPLVQRSDAVPTPIAREIRPTHPVVAHQPPQGTGPCRGHRPHRLPTLTTGRPLDRLPGRDRRDHRLDDATQHAAAQLLEPPRDPIQVGRHQLRPGLPQLAHEQLAQLLDNRVGQLCPGHQYPPWGPERCPAQPHGRVPLLPTPCQPLPLPRATFVGRTPVGAT